MENIDVRITQYPRKTVVSDFDIFLIADVSDIDVVTGFPKYKKVMAKDLPSIVNTASDITYAELLAKALEGELSVGEFYNITDSTSGVAPILVQAVSDSAIGYLAFDGDNPLLSINYDFITDTVRWSQNQETAPLSLTALSAVTPISYDDVTGVFTISQSSATTDGYLSSDDWQIFDAKQDALSGTGIVKSASGVISYITDNSSDWDTAYDDSIVSASVTGSSTKTLTLNQQDGGTITASWTDLNTNLVTSVFGRTGAVTAQNGDYTTTQVTEGTNLYYTQDRFNTAFGLKSTTDLTEGTNLYYTDLRARGAFSETVTGLTYNPTSGVLSTTSGYGIPTTASQSNWDTAYTNRITSASAPLAISTNNISIPQATSIANGYLTSGDWTTFNDKQPAGNYITTLTGEATASGPNSASVTLSNSAVIGKVLTGLNVTGGSVSASDSILAAFGKVQNQINGLIGGSIYQGVWNASTNSPALASGVGTKGYYYIVNVAGSTNLDGITDWNIGDWAIFDGTAWQQVDNTDAVVSVNGQTGIVNLTTSNISEGSNLYFTQTRVSANTDVAANTAARHSAVTLGTANGLSLSDQQLSLGLSSPSATGALSSTDWSTFNAKQAALSGSGIVKSSGGTISYLTDNSTNWNSAYNDTIVSAGVSGTSTKTLTLTQQDGGTVTTSWTDGGLTSVGLSMPSAFTVSNSPLTSNGTIAVTGAGTTSQYVRGDGSLATFPTVASEAQRLITEVYNETGATLTKGTIVYINGGHGNLPTVTKAIATGDATSAQTYGVVQADITDNNNGFVVVNGSLTDIDTFGLTAGQALYLSSTTAGTWTTVKQYAPAHLVYIATVTRVHPTQGIVEVRIQNGYEMDELHNVSAQTPANGDILQFNYSTQLWTKTAGTTTNIAEGTNLYYTSARFDSAFSGKTTTNLAEGLNLYYTAARFNAAFDSKTTSDLIEGTNLYYTAARFNSAFAAKSTTDLTEGTNLYFTDTRARAAITLTTTGTSGNATYSGGVLNIPNYGSALSGYLPLSGGTLTGALYGTTATFTGVVSAKGSAPYYQWLNASDTRLAYIQHNGSDLVISTDTGDIVLAPTGKVGIKNDAPSQNLTIGDGTGTGNQYVRIFASASDIYIGQSGGTLFGQSANSAGFVLSDNISFPFVVGTIAAKDLIFGTNNTARITVDGSTGALTATSSITASSFIKSGGTSSQALLADGSVGTFSASNWNTAYNDSIVSAAVSGTTTKTLTLTQQDGGTVTASWTDYDTAPVTSVFGRTGAVVAASGDYTTTQVTEGTNLYFTDTRARAAISLTTSGTSGAATYSGGVLNIPQYQAALTNPITGTGTTNYLPKFTGTSALGNSQIFDNGVGFVGFGTTTAIGNATNKVFKIEGADSANLIITNTGGATGALTSFGGELNLSTSTNHPLFFGTNGTERMRITSGGNVGIGTSSPSNGKLVVKDSGYQYIAEPTDSATYGYLGIGHFTNGTFIGTTAGSNTASDLLRFGTSGTERMRITSAGNVGIGTTIPSYKFQTSASVNSDWVGSFYNTSTTTPNGLQVRVGVSSTAQALGVYTDGIGYTFNVLGNGNVGIGITNPTDGKLQVAGSTQLGNTIAQTYLGVGASAIKVTSNGAFAIGLDGADGSTERMRITSGGNVLIGTTTDAGYKLDVNGTARVVGTSAGLRIESTSSGQNAEIFFASTATTWRVGQNIGTNTDFEIYNGGTLFKMNTSGAATFSSSVTAGQGKFYSGSSSIDGLIVGGAGGIGTTSQGVLRFGDFGNIYKIQGGQDYGAMNFLTNGAIRLTIAAGGDATFSSSVTATNFIGAGTGLTGTASALSIGGSAGSVAWSNISSKPNEIFNYDGWVTNPGYDANTIAGNKSGFTYANNAPYVGPLTHFASSGYGLQFNASYGGGTAIAYRTRNGDNATWNSWYNIVTSANINSYAWTASGSWKPASLSSSTRLIGIISPDGGDFGLAYSGGQIFPYTDGFFYQNEGAYRVIDTNSIGSYALPLSGGTLTGNLVLPNGYDLSWGGTYGANKPTISATDGTGIKFYPDGAASGSTFTVNTNGTATFTSNIYAYLAHVGYWGLDSDYARFGHLSFDGTSSYGFMQNNSGQTFVGSEYFVAIETPLTYTTGGFVAGATSIEASAILQADSSTQGFLPPRMTDDDMVNLSSPAAGLVIYNTDLNQLCVFNGTGWYSLNMTAL